MLSKRRSAMHRDILTFSERKFATSTTRVKTSTAFVLIAGQDRNDDRNDIGTILW